MMTISVDIHQCAFFSRLTLTFSASLSPSHLFSASFCLTLLFLIFLTCPSPFCCFRCLSTVPLLSLIPLRLCARPLHLHRCTLKFCGPFTLPHEKFPPPPLSLAQACQPYFLHTALPSYRPGFCNSQPTADPRPQHHVGRESSDAHCGTRWTPAASAACVYRDDSSADTSSVFNYDSLADVAVDSPPDYGNIYRKNTHSVHQSVSDSKTNDREFDSICNFDSLCISNSEQKHYIHTKSPVSGATEASACTTPYKNIDVMMTYSTGLSAVDSSLYSAKRSNALHGSDKARTSRELPPLPTYYLYHPKNCPLHRGAPPRLSPIGALSPPQRPGAPPPGTSGLSSPLFPRSHTLPALAAPLYYPNLYPPMPTKAPPLPPKLFQAPPQSRVASKISLSLSLSLCSPPLHFTHSLSLLSDILLACLPVCLSACLSV